MKANQIFKISLLTALNKMGLTSKFGNHSSQLCQIKKKKKTDNPAVLKNTKEIAMRHLILTAYKSGQLPCQGGYTLLLQYLH